MHEHSPGPRPCKVEAAREAAPQSFAVGYQAGLAEGRSLQAERIARLESDLALARSVLRHPESVRQTAGSESMTAWTLNFLRRTPWFRQAVDYLLGSGTDPRAGRETKSAP